jgi:hypothetical protein
MTKIFARKICQKLFRIGVKGIFPIVLHNAIRFESDKKNPTTSSRIPSVEETTAALAAELEQGAKALETCGAGSVCNIGEKEFFELL